MTIANWTPRKALEKLEKKDVFESWLVGLKDFEDATYLRIAVEGTWSLPLGQLEPCEPDGYCGLAVPAEKLIIADCPYGALIGRFGGGSAGFLATAADAAAGRPFPLGKFAVVQVPTGSMGPLFIGFNSTIRPVKVDTLSLAIDGSIPTQ